MRTRPPWARVRYVLRKTTEALRLPLSFYAQNKPGKQTVLGAVEVGRPQPKATSSGHQQPGNRTSNSPNNNVECTSGIASVHQSLEATSSASTLSANALTTTTALQIADNAEPEHRDQFTPEQIQVVLEQYPHGRFRHGRLYLRQCFYCNANAVTDRNGDAPHFFRGDMGFARHMRGHGFSSGLGSNNVDDHCVLGEPVSREDVLAMSRREKPRVPVILKVASCFSERKMQKDSKESGRWFRDTRPQSQTNTDD